LTNKGHAQEKPRRESTATGAGTPSASPDPLGREHPTIVKWLEHFRIVEQEAIELVNARRIYLKTWRIINRSPVARQPSAFYPWLASIYGEAMCMRVRRLIDKKPRTNSLRSLLEKIRKNSQLITLERQIAMYSKGAVISKLITEDTAKKDFQRWCRQKDIRCLPSSEVQRDIEELVSATQKIQTHGDKVVAHLDRKRKGRPAVYGDLDRAIRCIERTMIRYGNFLKGSQLPPFLTLTDDWTAIFRRPWIEGPQV